MGLGQKTGSRQKSEGGNRRGGRRLPAVGSLVVREEIRELVKGWSRGKGSLILALLMGQTWPCLLVCFTYNME